jgi:hypothetical protein
MRWSRVANARTFKFDVKWIPVVSFMPMALQACGNSSRYPVWIGGYLDARTWTIRRRK